ncbi:uncharacterized protein LOC128986004 isoform X2 [Macrosteles quadrilineatus]|nr:uncharacterized protein LOC128986004 isoform X2 [Macrosteles quadrilineatus]
MAMFESPLMNLQNYHTCHLIPLYTDPDTGSHICPDWLKFELFMTVILDFSLSIAQITISFLLLLGVYQTKPRLILQWVVLQLAMIIIDIVLTNSSYIRESEKYNMNYFYIFYITWKSLEAYGVYICYCYYISVISDPTQIV